MCGSGCTSACMLLALCYKPFSFFLSYVHPQLWLVLIPSIPLITPTIISTPAASLLQPAAISIIRQTHGQLAPPCPIQTGLIPQVRRMTWLGGGGTLVWKAAIRKQDGKARPSRTDVDAILWGRAGLLGVTGGFFGLKTCVLLLRNKPPELSWTYFHIYVCAAFELLVLWSSFFVLFSIRILKVCLILQCFYV